MARAIPAVLLGLLCSFAAAAAPTLRIVRGGGDFETLETAITVGDREALKMQWVIDQPGAKSGTWQVTNANAVVVASGEAAAPTQVGHMTRFTIEKTAFLLVTSPVDPTAFKITIRAYDVNKQPLGGASNAVTVTQVKFQPQPPVDFGEGARFPTVEVISYQEKFGVVPSTQLHYAYADVQVRVRNGKKKPTDRMWLSLEDFNVLMRQTQPPVKVPSLKEGEKKVYTIHLDAVLPAPTSQLPEEKQYSTWCSQYGNSCGVDLRAVLDWRGPQAQAPVNDHLEITFPPGDWADFGDKPCAKSICDAVQCVKPCEMLRQIRKQLDGHVVGYSCFAGQSSSHYDSYGKARSSFDGAISFSPTTKITVASVSKLVTAIAAVRILDQKGVSVDAKIGPFLPSDWSPGEFVKNLTFAQLLSHRSGIKDYGNVEQNYDKLRTFFTQPVSSNTTACQGSDVIDPPDPINPGDKSPCYSNYNFAIFRLLLPKVAGLAEDPNPATRPQTLADQYVTLVQQNVFDPVGQKHVTCAPPATGGDARSYLMPGTGAGTNWGDVSLQCGGAGWYLSAVDMAKVLLSISAKDGKILPETSTKHSFDTMRQRFLGFDVATDVEVEKNGAWFSACDSEGKNCRTISTTAAVFGPVFGPRLVGVLFINSNISGGPSNGIGAKEVLEKAYIAALKPK